MRSWLPLLVCPLMSGCFAFGYPSITETPSIMVAEDSVRAFRITWQLTRYGGAIAGAIRLSQDIEEIPIVATTVAGQEQVYFAYGYLLFPFAGSESRSLSVLLYRPGYETVEVPARSWWRCLGPDKPLHVEWKPARDLEAQVSALEKVINTIYKGKLKPEVAQFAAQEYTRLAQSPLASSPEKADLRDRLLTQAGEYEALVRRRQ